MAHSVEKALKDLAAPAVFRKIAWENGAKLLKFKG